MPHSNCDVLDQFWHVSVFGFAKTCKNRQMPQDSQRYHFCALWCKKQPCALGRLCDIPIYPCDALATFSVFGFRQFATHSSYFHPLPANFPAWVCSVRNVHSGCCGTALVLFAWSAVLIAGSAVAWKFISERGFHVPAIPGAMKQHETP